MSAVPEAMIGLEIHVQLATRSKMFCGNAAEYGAPPNVHVCPVCLGLPGALPVLNARAVELGARAALGLGATVHTRSAFARKAYHYPDLPRGYQITQHDHPLATGGELEFRGGEGARRVRIRRVHLEEDTGRSLHDRVPGRTALDLNRAGVPLVEIVTEPDLHDPADARAFLVGLRQLLRYLEVSDCSMEEGSLRVDVNVSVRGAGEEPGPRTEVKNLNSFSQVERALAYEIARQRELRATGAPVVAATLLWDPVRGEARPMRRKTSASEYRFVPEPDLPPLVLEPGWVQRLAEGLPEPPWARAARLRHQHDLAVEHAEALTATRELADYYEAVVAAGADGRLAAGWVLGEVLALANASGRAAHDMGVGPAALAELLELVERGALPRPLAREVLARMAVSGRSAARVVAEDGLVAVRGAGEVAGWVEEVLSTHPNEVARYREGDVRLLGFFVGQVMRASAGRADPPHVTQLLRERLDG